jgi:phosphatidylglycerophosphatase A
LNRVREFFLSLGGVGYMPFASGSWGSLLATLLFLLCWGAGRRFGAPAWTDEAVLAAGIAVACVMSIAWGPWAIREWGRKDPKPFVLDEFAGQWLAFVLLPPIATTRLPALLAVVACQFFLFRVFDVLKPPPARQIDRHWPGGWGILCDDLVAGLFANLVGQAIWRYTDWGPRALSALGW